MGPFIVTSQRFAELVAGGTEQLASAIELIGVITILIALAIGLAPYVSMVIRREPTPTVSQTRRRMGRGLVFSLEIFVAADLLRTLPNPDLSTVTTLGVIAIVRVILGLSLEYELRHLPSSEEEASIAGSSRMTSGLRGGSS